MFFKLLGHSTFLFIIITVISLIFGVAVSVVATSGEIGQVRHFVVSPNNSKILFVSETSTGEDRSGASVMLFDFATGDVIGLTGVIQEAALSPDEKLIAYVEIDNYYGNALSLTTSEGIQLKLRYHHHLQRFSQLRWSKDSKYLTFISDGPTEGKKTIIISPQIGLVPDDLTRVEWQEPKKLPADHPIYQKKPTVKADSTVLWGDDKTIYVQAVDGIWKGNLDEPFIVRWEKIVAAEDIPGPQAINISSTGTHLLYKRVTRRNPYDGTIVSNDIWVLSLKAGATPVKVGEGLRAQFTPDGQSVLLVNVGLWIVSLDGSSRRRLTSQQSLP